MASKPRARAKPSPAQPTFFARPDQFRAWLSKHHATAPELLVGFYKRDSGKPSMTWPQSVDQALCFGWIDGIRRRVDEVSYTIRFTPRRAGSRWSSINIKRVAELEALGHMHEAGLAAFARRSEEKSRLYSYEQRFHSKLEPAQEGTFRANRKAWAFFQAQAPWYQRAVTHYIVSAAREETRAKRLQRIIDESAKGRRIV